MAKTRKYNQRKSTRGKTPKKKNKMRQKGSGRDSRTDDGKRINCNNNRNGQSKEGQTCWYTQFNNNGDIGLTIVRGVCKNEKCVAREKKAYLDIVAERVSQLSKGLTVRSNSRLSNPNSIGSRIVRSTLKSSKSSKR